MPRRLPKKLFNICNDYIISLIINIVLSLPRDVEVDEKLQSLQDYILKYVCPRLVDNLLLTAAPCWILNDDQKVMLLKILMHPSMITLSTRFKLPSRDNFYEVRLKELKRLVVLNLSMVCTDEILEVVGSNCHLLQVVHIVSKIGSVTCKTKRQLNALKLKFFVSDKGLEHLHKCKFLKTVIMNKVIRSNCGGRKITHDGIRKLLRALPKLQFISYNDMGLVMKHGIAENEKFNLLHLHDSHIRPVHIDTFVKHCPDIKGLCLMLPKDEFWNPDACLFKLANSELKLSSLALSSFRVRDAFNHFLSVKGLHLTSLCLSHDIKITTETVYFIGLNCPHLEYLEVLFVIPGDQDDRTLKAIKNKKMFTNLHSLKILGSHWNPQIIIPLCINNANYLNNLILLDRDYYKYIDELILNLLKINPLVKLRHITLLDGFYVRTETLLRFVQSMENLESIMVSNKLSYINHLEQLKIDNNLNLSIKSACMIGDDNRNYGNCLCYYWQKGSLGTF